MQSKYLAQFDKKIYLSLSLQKNALENVSCVNWLNVFKDLKKYFWICGKFLGTLKNRLLEKVNQNN